MRLLQKSLAVSGLKIQRWFNEKTQKSAVLLVSEMVIGALIDIVAGHVDRLRLHQTLRVGMEGNGDDRVLQRKDLIPNTADIVAFFDCIINTSKE